MIAKTLALSSRLCLKPKKNAFQVKNLGGILFLSIKNANIIIEIEEFLNVITLKSIEFTIFPTTTAPTISTLSFSKTKETDVDFTKCIELKVFSINIEITNLFMIVLKDIKFEIVNATDTRVKYVNKLLNAVVLKKTEKTSLNLCYLQVFADGEVVLASPAEFSRDDIITSKLHNAFRVLEENGEVYCSVPPVGIVFEVLLIKDIVSQLIQIPTIEIDKFQGFENNFIVNPDSLLKNVSVTRIIACLTNLAVKFKYNSNLILNLKVQNLYIHNNMTKGFLEKYLNSGAKESLDNKDEIYSDPSEIGMIIKKIEISPSDSVHDQIIEMAFDYSIIIKISSILKKISIQARKPIKLIIINKTLEELILSIKSIKSVIPKNPEKKKSNDFTLDCDLVGGEIIIPQNSLSFDYVRLFFDHCKVNVNTDKKILYKPTPINENTPVFKDKIVLHDTFEPSYTASCDLVTLIIKNIKIETFIRDKLKKLGSVLEVIVNASVPTDNEPLEPYL